ncbi:hypothetical protein [Streptomyces noursei]|uniref:hypothetical protein n=1 Tax=Streptomyces noursei TaxID=1971 RepID=UPI0023B77942|nr:hypothetical protein [Streptomyces noursei]
MTTPADQPPTPPIPGYPPTVGQGPGGPGGPSALSSPPPHARRTVVGAVVLALLLVGGAVWWQLAAAGGGMLDGRPRVHDTAAGLSYACPEGWTHSAAEDRGLISAFSSTITKRGPEATFGVILTGSSTSPIPSYALQQQAEYAARSNAEFFYPDQASTIESSRPTTVSGHPAHQVTVRVQAEEGRVSSAGRLTITIVTTEGAGARSAFILGLTSGTGPSGAAITRDVDAVVQSAAVEAAAPK